jgi:hypothetical protein
VIVLLLLWLSVARADFLVESPTFATRAEAETMATGLGAPGTRVFVVRHLRPGVGWRWVVRVEGLGTEGEAQAMARRLSVGVRTATLFADQRGWVRSPHSLPATAPAKVGDGLSRRQRRAGKAEAWRMMRAAVERQLDAEGWERVTAAAKQLELCVDRRVQRGAREELSRWCLLRSGPETLLEVSGAGGPIALRRLGGPVQLASGESADWGGDLFESMEPEVIFGPILTLGVAVDHGADWSRLRPCATQPEAGKRSLCAGPDPVGGLVEVAFSKVVPLLSSLSWLDDTGVTTWKFDDYRDVAGQGLVPLHQRVERGGALLEDRRIVRLRIGDQVIVDDSPPRTSGAP